MGQPSTGLWQFFGCVEPHVAFHGIKDFSSTKDDNAATRSDHSQTARLISATAKSVAPYVANMSIKIPEQPGAAQRIACMSANTLRDACDSSDQVYLSKTSCVLAPPSFVRASSGTSAHGQSFDRFLPTEVLCQTSTPSHHPNSSMRCERCQGAPPAMARRYRDFR